MKSAVFTGKGKIVVENRDLPQTGNNDVLIKVMAAGICGTDVHIFHGEAGSADVNPPVVLGHEFAGVVTSIGEDVTGIKEGDKVNVDPNIYCGHCQYCNSGRKQLCSNMKAVGVTMDGGFHSTV